MSGRLDSGARGVSLAAALALMVLVTLFPRGLTGTGGQPLGHGALALVMWGLSAGFVHGVGFVPRTPILRILLALSSPSSGWAWGSPSTSGISWGRRM